MPKKDETLRMRSRSLRRDMTKEERHLWYDCLKALPVTVHRQYLFPPYIVDFYIASARLVIELDGSQHYDDAGKEYDQRRDAFLRGLGLTVRRYSNADLALRFPAVCEDIYRLLGLSD